MATFRVYLLGNHQPLLLDLPVTSIGELIDLASRAKFIGGVMAEADEDGVCCGVMVQTCRIQLAVEV